MNLQLFLSPLYFLTTEEFHPNPIQGPDHHSISLAPLVSMNMTDSFRDSDVTLSDAEDDGDNIGLLQKGQRFRGQRSTRRRVCFFFQSRPMLSTLCVTAVLVATNILTWHAATRITRHSVTGNVAEPPKIARVIRELDVTQTHHTKYDSTFYNYGNPFRGPPGPETDAVWENDAGAACMNPSQIACYCLGGFSDILAPL